MWWHPVLSLTNLMMLVFSPLLAPARIFHEIYQRLTQTNDDVIKVRIINDHRVKRSCEMFKIKTAWWKYCFQELKEFMEKYQPHPVDVLQARDDFHDIEKNYDHWSWWLCMSRVAEVGKLSASAKNAFNSFVRRIFVNSRQKTLFFLIYYQNCNKKVVFT